jgi:lipid II isoglutaminyl synthase (glutamine-hydrolysing)
MNTLLILLGKLISSVSKLSNLGNGSTWPGHIALSLNQNFIKDILRTNSQRLTTILIAGTNGKTTTGKLIQAILEKDSKKVFQNTAGANLLNGVASTIIFNSNLAGKINKDFAVFEIDENTFPNIVKEIYNPDYIILLNLFRDQLDRYGEVNTIVSKWKDAIRHLPSNTTLVLNADDPQVASLGRPKLNVLYFGINHLENKNQTFQHASDSTYCPKCSEKLTYESIFFSHLGNWSCKKCGYKHPENTFTHSSYYPLSGVYNQYNVHAASLLAKTLGINEKIINSALAEFKPAFGRQEILNINGKRVQIFLSKNPTSLNESLKTLASFKANNLLIVLNDRIPDGRDVSWIWDVDFEDYSTQFKDVTVSGDRTFDMGLRLKYAEYNNFKTEDNLTDAVNISLKNIQKDETLCILATYSAMLEVRKILTGKKIL